MRILKDIWDGIAPFNLLEPVYRHDIRVMMDSNGDIRVFIENPPSREVVVDICNTLVKAAHLVAMKHQIRMIIEPSEPKKEETS